MKKKIILAFGILFNILVFGQLKKGIELNDNSINVVIGDSNTEGRAHFKGGDKELRRLILKEIDSNTFPERRSLTCHVYFTITDKGNMTDVFPVSQDEKFSLAVLNAIKKINPKWTPAKLNGKFTKSRMSFPIFFE